MIVDNNNSGQLDDDAFDCRHPDEDDWFTLVPFDSPFDGEDAAPTNNKSLISENMDLRKKLLDEKNLVMFIQGTAVDDDNNIRGRETAVQERETAVQEREQHQKRHQETITARFAALVKQEQKLKASEAVMFVNMQMAKRELCCAEEVKQRSDKDVCEAIQMKAKYKGLVAKVQCELDRLKQGAPMLGAPRVTRKYGRESCVFCGYYYCATFACGVCTTKYMEGRKGVVGQVRSEGILEAVIGAGYTGFQLVDIEKIPVKVQQLLFSKLC